jgi:hypothetical protein
MTKLTIDDKKKLDSFFQKHQLFTDSDVQEFAEENNLPYRTTYNYLFSLCHPNLKCAKCRYRGYAWDSYPCNKCRQNPHFDDCFDEGDEP